MTTKRRKAREYWVALEDACALNWMPTLQIYSSRKAALLRNKSNRVFKVKEVLPRRKRNE